MSRSTHPNPDIDVAVVGAGPAGLMAAEVLCKAGRRVAVYDAMPSAGRKFLLAGKGGLNLTHAEAFDAFVARYRQPDTVRPWLDAWGPTALRAWAQGLGIDTFVGSSQRVFPVGLKAAPLLRAWLHRLRAAGIAFHMRHRWIGFDDAGALRFEAPLGEQRTTAQATVLALGGASWPQLGSNGAWVPLLEPCGVGIAPLRPANCGFDIGWSALLRARHAGAPIKPVVLAFTPRQGASFRRQGEFVLTETGIEGSLVYAVSAALRDEIAMHGDATIELDLLPAFDAARVRAEVRRPRGPRSLATHLKSRLGIDGAKAALVYEVLGAGAAAAHDLDRLAATLKALPLRLTAPRPLAEAISTAGGVRFDSLDDALMLRARPAVFCAGEMLDWEAPTGGYLLTASLASGRVAGLGAAAWLASHA